MAQVIFNGLSSKAMTLNNYNRTTSFDDARNIVSNGYMSLLPAADTVTTLTQLMASGVNNIVIKNDSGDVIYTLPNINGQITSIQESYSGGDHIDVYINLTMDQAASQSGN